VPAIQHRAERLVLEAEQPRRPHDASSGFFQSSSDELLLELVHRAVEREVRIARVNAGEAPHHDVRARLNNLDLKGR
jgi:hypothetical protein